MWENFRSDCILLANELSQHYCDVAFLQILLLCREINQTLPFLESYSISLETFSFFYIFQLYVLVLILN